MRAVSCTSKCKKEETVFFVNYILRNCVYYVDFIGVGMCVKRRRDISAEFHAGSVSAAISCVLTLWMHHAQ